MSSCILKSQPSDMWPKTNKKKQHFNSTEGDHSIPTSHGNIRYSQKTLFLTSHNFYKALENLDETDTNLFFPKTLLSYFSLCLFVISPCLLKAFFSVDLLSQEVLPKWLCVGEQSGLQFQHVWPTSHSHSEIYTQAIKIQKTEKVLLELSTLPSLQVM